MVASRKESYDKPRKPIKKQRYHFANRGPCSQSYGFSSSHVWMWELDYKEDWALKNWCFWTVVLEKTLESPLGFKEIKPVHPKGNQSWIFIEKNDAEVSILWPPDAKSRVFGKDPDAREDWSQNVKGTTEDEMVRLASLAQWIRIWANSGRKWKSLAYCSPWGHKESDTT